MQDAKPKRYRKMDSKINRLIIEEAVKNFSLEEGQIFYKVRPVYDGQKNMYTAKPLNLQSETAGDSFPGLSHRIFVDFVDEKSTQYALNFKLVGQIKMEALQDYISGKPIENPSNVSQVINIVLRHGPTLFNVPIGNSLFSTNNDVRQNIGGGRQLAFGFFQSVRVGSSGCNLVIDRSCTAFYCAGFLPKFVAEILGLNKQQFCEKKTFSDSDRKRVLNELLGREIVVKHLTYKRKYKVIGLTRESAQEKTFEMKKTDPRGKEISYGLKSVVEFFAETYPDLTLKMPHLPCIEVGSKKAPSYLPLEVCELVSDQHVRNNLTGQQMATMIRASASQLPRQRLDLIRNASSEIAKDSKIYMNEFGIKIAANKPLTIQARILEAPTLQFNNAELKPFDGKWDMKRRFFYNSVPLKNWILVSFSSHPDQLLEKFRSELVSVGKQMGMEIVPPLRTAKIKKFEAQTITKIFERARTECGKLQLIVFVIPESNNLYEMIKYSGDVHFKILTQCINDKSLLKINSAFITNVLLKVNTKIGGVNVILKNLPAKPAILKEELTMVVGIDFSHPGVGDTRSASVASCVGSYDKDHVRYAACIRIQTKAKFDAILDIKDIFNELLEEFYSKNNNKYPTKIIVYRDGVSEGQFNQVVCREIDGIKKTCEAIAVNCKLTFIVVQKRHHTRLFPAEESEGVGRARNIPPGLVVDTDVVSPNEFDYYLCSHEGIQGTSRPTHYHILRDENNMTADDVQLLTYYLTHVYARCMRSISAPAPVAYAHLAAYRAQRHIIGYSLSKDESYSFTDGHSTSGSSQAPFRRHHQDLREIGNQIVIDPNYRAVMYFC